MGEFPPLDRSGHFVFEQCQAVDWSTRDQSWVQDLGYFDKHQAGVCGVESVNYLVILNAAVRKLRKTRTKFSGNSVGERFQRSRIPLT